MGYEPCAIFCDPDNGAHSDRCQYGATAARVWGDSAARWKALAKVFRLRYRGAVDSYEREIAELETALAIAEHERDEALADLRSERLLAEDLDV